MPVILPTGTCFDDALDLLGLFLTEDPSRAQDEHLILVHGIATGTGSGLPEGQPYAHAWVEDGDLVWDAGVLYGKKVYYAAAKVEWYAERHIQRCTRYSLREACQHNLRSGNYGPWEDAYLALCKGQSCRTTRPLKKT